MNICFHTYELQYTQRTGQECYTGTCVHILPSSCI